MILHKIIIERIISSEGQTISEAKSIVTASSDNQSEISQSVSVNISSGNRSTSWTKSSSSNL
jgi:predicted RNA-binding protein YlqC (UPF0109 family)